jgi:imidazolonepropionase-like amidohydrolase
MKVILLYVSLLLLLFSCRNSQDFSNATAITNVSTIDAKDGIQKRRTVIFEGGRIVKVGDVSDLESLKFKQKFDGTGKFLIPGLWDAHVHFAYIEELAPSMFDLFLAYGVTSVRDTGGKLDFVRYWKNQANLDSLNAPRVMIAGPLLDGHPNVYDGSMPTRPPLSLGAKSVEDAVNLVHTFDSVGVDLIKSYEMLTPEQFEAVLKASTGKGLKVTGHVPLSMDVRAASNAGLASMEHLRNLEMSCATNWKELLQKRREMLFNGRGETGYVLRSNIHTAQRIEAIENYDDKVADSVLNNLKSNDTWQIPTLSIMTASTNRHFLKDEYLKSFELLPPEVKAKWKSGSTMFGGRPINPERKKYSDWLQMMVKKVNDKEISIMAGTDCPIFFLTPGLSLHEELKLLVDSGLTPLEALESATITPAKYFDLDHKLGLIREGYLADFVLLSTNPLENISNTKDINMVVKNGSVKSREDLDIILNSLRDQ